MADKTLPPLAFGDSLADGIRTNNKLEGKTRSGAGPREVLDMILSYSLDHSLEGRDVYIGTGIPNIPTQKKFIEEQVELVKRKGGRPILIGVGPGTEKNPTTGQNEFLAELTKRKGLPFMGPLINIYPDVAKDKMGLHLKPAQYKQIIKQFSSNAPKVEVAPPAPARNPMTVPAPTPSPQQIENSVRIMPIPGGQPNQKFDRNLLNNVPPSQSARDQAPRVSNAANMLAQVPNKGGKFDPDVYLQDPNVNKFLDYINVYEGSPKANQMVAFKPFNSFADHPRTKVVFNKKGDVSDAAGMFQILSRTWDGQRKKLGLKDFSPENQRRAAVGILHDIGALPDIVSGNFDRAKPKAARQWASIPGSTIGLSTGQVPRYKEKAEAILGQPPRRAGNPMAPRTEAPVEDYKPGSTLESVPRTAQQGPATAPPQDQITRADMERFGPNYQAAFAAVSLADTRDDDDEYDDDETIAERYMERRGEQLAQEEESTLEQEEPTRTSSLSTLDLSYQSPFGPEPGTEEQQPVMLADGGVVYRADGSPMYGEDAALSGASGPITQDTITAFKTSHPFNAREALMMLKDIGKAGLSNVESVARGAVAAVPGTAGEMESVFRDDKKRIFANSREVERQYLPKRLTAPTAEEDMFTEIGTFVNPDFAAKPILTKALPRATKGVKDAYKAVVDKFAPVAKPDTFPTSKMSAEELAQYLKAYDPQAAAKAREAFLAPSAEKRRMYHGTFQYPTSNMVTDSTGGLRIMGADQGFTSFKPGTGGMTFVTPQTEFADMFAGMRLGSASKLTGPSRIYPVHVQVKKPFDFENASHLKEIAAEVYKSSKKLKKKEAELGTSWMSSPEDIAFALSRGSWSEIENPLVINAAKKLGFDGMYMMEAGVKNLGIFDPKKIKSAIGNEGAFDVRKPDIRKAHGGVVHRADGSPIYGEVADSGPITEDTRAAFRNMKMPDVRDAREALKLLKSIGREGVSNLESLARGSVAGVPGIVGDIESIFRDDKARKFATSTEVERDYLPKRMSKATKESQGFVEIGTAIDPSIALKAAKPTAKLALEAIKSSGPQIEAALMKAAPAAKPMNIVKPEGGNWFPERENADAVNHFINNLIKDTVAFDLRFKDQMQNIAENSLNSAKATLQNSNESIKRIYEQHNVASRSRKEKIELARDIKPSKARQREAIADAQKKLDEANAEKEVPQSIADFIEKKLQPYIRNNLGTESDQVRLGIDKWELELKPKLIAEKQKQINKVQADIDKAVAARGDIDPLMLTNSQDRLRTLMREMEALKARTGSFFQMGRGDIEALAQRWSNPDVLRHSVVSKNRQAGLQTTADPATLVKAKSSAGKVWEGTVDSAIDVYSPQEAANLYATNFMKEPPAWLKKAEDSGSNAGIFSLSYRPNDPFASQIRHMIDELQGAVDPYTDLPKELRRTPSELRKMSVEDASSLVDKINGWRASNPTGIDLARANNPAVTRVKEYSTVPQVVGKPPVPNQLGMHWVEITTPKGMPKDEARTVLNDALKYEGEIMKHCVGTYCPSVESGTRIFSLRDNTGRPYTTIEAVPDIQEAKNFIKGSGKESFLNESGSSLSGVSDKEIVNEVKRLGYKMPFEIKQIKGVSNGRPIEEAVPFIKDFVEDPAMDWTSVPNF